jgi:hypothetical protein
LGKITGGGIAMELVWIANSNVVAKPELRAATLVSAVVELDWGANLSMAAHSYPEPSCS